jgi:hypothetical protein
MREATAFIVEHWQHVGNEWSGEGPAAQFFIIKVSGPRGRWPLKAYIMGPGIADESLCTPQEDEIDLETLPEAFIDLECPVEDPQEGQYLMRLYIASHLCGDFPFVIRNGNGASKDS